MTTVSKERADECSHPLIHRILGGCTACWTPDEQIRAQVWASKPSPKDCRHSLIRPIEVVEMFFSKCHCSMCKRKTRPGLVQWTCVDCRSNLGGIA